MIQEEAQRSAIYCSNPRVESATLVAKSQNVNVNSGSIMLETMGIKEKISQFAPTVVSLVTPLINAISYMDSTLVTSSRAKFQWHIK